MGHRKVHRERRVNERVYLDGLALLVERGTPIGKYKLENLSAGGALVAGGHRLRPGHLVHVLMDLTTGQGPMSMTGAVRRQQHDGKALALSFPSLSPDQEDAIQDAVLRALLRRESQSSRSPVLVFEPRPRVRLEIETELRSFGLPFVSVDNLGEAISELEDEETEYAGIVIHSVTHDPSSMEVVEFFARSEGLKTIIMPEPDGELPPEAKRLASLPHVVVPRIWSPSELRRAIRN